MAYTLLTHVQNKLLQNNNPITERELRKALDTMQLSLIKNNDDFFYLRSANKDHVDMLVNRMGLRKLPNIIPKGEIKNYV